MIIKTAWVICLASMLAVVASGTVQAEDFEFEVMGPFDARQLPHMTDEERQEWENYVTQYPDIVPWLVVAVSKFGESESFWARDRRQEDRIRSAMHICEHQSGGACGLAVVDGEMVKFKVMPRQLSYLERFDSRAVPFATESGIADIQLNYAQQPEHKALALNWIGSLGYSHGQESEDAAVSNAFDLCRDFSNELGKCFLYDVNGKVVFTPETDIFGNR